MTQREWRRKKAEMELRKLQKSATRLVAELDDDFDAATKLARVAQACGEARHFFAAEEAARRAG